MNIQCNAVQLVRRHIVWQKLNSYLKLQNCYQSLSHKKIIDTNYSAWFRQFIHNSLGQRRTDNKAGICVCKQINVVNFTNINFFLSQ